MCIINDAILFIRKGIAALRNASKGQFNECSGEVADFRYEILNSETSRSDDKNNLFKDKKNIERDIRKSFDKLSMSKV